MKTKALSVAWVGLVGCGAVAVVATGCRTRYVHTHTSPVYVPPPQVVHLPPPPQPPPSAVVVATPSPVVVAPAPAPPPSPQPPPPIVVASPAAPVVVIRAESDFYEPLGIHGRWVVIGSHGRCWVPARVEAGWRPYCNGYWQRTDAGWYWMSSEPWGWATYHYGRWDWRADLGWFWVPQTQWAPAWVVWREGGGYIGWAPLRPSVRTGVSVGFFDYEPAHAARAFVFVEPRRLLEPIRPGTVVVNNPTIINRTVNITRVQVVNQTVIAEGPKPEVIERASGRKIRAVPAHEFRHREETTVAARERHIPTVTRPIEPTPVRHNPQPAPAVLPALAPPRTPPPPTRDGRLAETPPATPKPVAAVPQPSRPAARATAAPALKRPQPTPVPAPPPAPEPSPVHNERTPAIAASKQPAAPVATTATNHEPRAISFAPPAPTPQAPAVSMPAPTPNPTTQPAPVAASRDNSRLRSAVERPTAPPSQAAPPAARGESRPKRVAAPAPATTAPPSNKRPDAPPAAVQPQSKPFTPAGVTDRRTARVAPTNRLTAAEEATQERETNAPTGRSTRQPW